MAQYALKTNPIGIVNPWLSRAEVAAAVKALNSIGGKSLSKGRLLLGKLESMDAKTRGLIGPVFTWAEAKSVAMSMKMEDGAKAKGETWWRHCEYRDQLLHAVEDGMSLAEASKVMNMSRERVRQLAVKYGVKWSRNAGRPSTPCESKFLSAAKNWVRVKRLQSRFGLTKTMVDDLVFKLVESGRMRRDGDCVIAVNA
jgi:hypothetical protein